MSRGESLLYGERDWEAKVCHDLCSTVELKRDERGVRKYSYDTRRRTG